MDVDRSRKRDREDGPGEPFVPDPNNQDPIGNRPIKTVKKVTLTSPGTLGSAWRSTPVNEQKYPIKELAKESLLVPEKHKRIRLCTINQTPIMVGTLAFTLKDECRRLPIENHTKNHVEVWIGQRGGVFMADPVTRRIARLPWLHMWKNGGPGKGNIRNYVSLKLIPYEEKAREIRPSVIEANAIARQPAPTLSQLPARTENLIRQEAARNRGQAWKQYGDYKRREKKAIAREALKKKQEKQKLKEATSSAAMEEGLAKFEHEEMLRRQEEERRRATEIADQLFEEHFDPAAMAEDLGGMDDDVDLFG